MCNQFLAESTKLAQICEQIFATGEYVPSTGAEAEAVRSLGFELRGSTLVLPAGIEYLDENCIEQELRNDTSVSHLNSVVVKKCVGSTNQELLMLARSSDLSGTVLFAELQTSGRGRFGRSWHSPVGRNLAVSLGARVSREPDDLGAISLVIGVAVANAIQELGIDDITLKWPNDILLDKRKVGGILVDVVHAMSPIEIVVGIGLNIGGGSLIGEVVDNPIADLLDHCSPPIRNRLAVSIVRNVYDAIRSFESQGFHVFRERWSALDALSGISVTVSTPGESIQGIARDVRQTGELCIELEDGTIHHVIAGDVSLDYT